VTVYKRPPTLQHGVRDHFFLHHMNFSSSLLTLIVTSVHLQYHTARHRAITSEEGSEPGYIIVCFVVRTIISELKRTIFTTLFLSVQKKNIDYKQRLPIASSSRTSSPSAPTLLVPRGTSVAIISAKVGTS
jgi:hypothetical protein